MSIRGRHGKGWFLPPVTCPVHCSTQPMGSRAHGPPLTQGKESSESPPIFHLRNHSTSQALLQFMENHQPAKNKIVLQCRAAAHRRVRHRIAVASRQARSNTTLTWRDLAEPYRTLQCSQLLARFCEPTLHQPNEQRSSHDMRENFAFRQHSPSSALVRAYFCPFAFR